MCSQAAALLWAADCLEGLNDVERERLAGVKEATETNSVPLVPVQSKKQLAEWVQVYKICHQPSSWPCFYVLLPQSKTSQAVLCPACGCTEHDKQVKSPCTGIVS